MVPGAGSAPVACLELHGRRVVAETGVDCPSVQIAGLAAEVSATFSESYGPATCRGFGPAVFVSYEISYWTVSGSVTCEKLKVTSSVRPYRVMRLPLVSVIETAPRPTPMRRARRGCRRS